MTLPTREYKRAMTITLHVHDSKGGLLVTTVDGEDGYCVTHDDSGLVIVGPLPSLSDAKDMMHLVAPLADWTQPNKKLGDMVELNERIQRALGGAR